MDCRRRCRRIALAALLAGAGAGCHSSGAGGADAGDDGPFADATTPADAITPLSIDFTATGCDSFDLDASRCTGAAPLTVTLSPVASPSVTQFLWDFGDGTPSSKERAPTHVYTFPGSYAVSLVGAGPGGTLSRMRRDFIVVPMTATGWPCDVDAQCSSGHCVCGSAGSCGAGFLRGICTTDCAAAPCGDGTVCADLSLGTPAAPVAAAPYQRALCLAACADDTACAAGLHCRSLPASGGGIIHVWVRACFAAVPGDVGDPCRGPDGALTGSACTSGGCADLGALGICSASCDATGGCPAGAVCARFGDGRLLCVRSCAGAADCAADPLLACESAGMTGALGFNIVSPGVPATACAPRSCATSDDCQPSGTCADGHCGPR